MDFYLLIPDHLLIITQNKIEDNKSLDQQLWNEDKKSMKRKKIAKERKVIPDPIDDRK